MKTTNYLLTVATATLACAIAQAAELQRSDRVFFEKAAKSGMKEVCVSEESLPKLSTADGKEFAQMMVSDHTKANEELKALAMRKGVTLPPKDEKLVQKWREKTKDVDDDYFKEMVGDHQEAVDLFEKASKSEDPDIAAFAQKTLPALKHHLEMAKAKKKMH